MSLKTPLLALLILVFGMALLGAGCQKAGVSSKIDWPEICAKKDPPKDFPKEYIMPESLTGDVISIGTGGESASTGEAYAGEQNGFTGSFCTEATPEEVITWYTDSLNDKGYKKLGEMDGEHVFTKGNTTINVWSKNIAEGFSFYSFSIMTANF